MVVDSRTGVPLNVRGAGAVASAPAVARREVRYDRLRFPGADRVRMTRDGFDAYDGRIEYWDRRASAAWVVRDVSAVHEWTSRRLPHLVERIASLRGAPIVSLGSVSLVLRDAEGWSERAMEADETVYLHPARAVMPRNSSLTVGQHDFPDVVLEVDHTTDVRPGKLPVYEAWGVPELWVMVPPEGATRRKPAGVTIHTLEGGRYLAAASSRAFPGWLATEINTALTEPVPTAATCRVLERVGRALGAREGAGPEDDPLSRRLIAEGRAEGHAEGRAEDLAITLRTLLVMRGRQVSPDFPADPAALLALPRETVTVAALA